MLLYILFPNPLVPSRDEGILAKKCPPGLGNHFLGSRNAFPDQEVIFYPQKVLSRVGKPFFGSGMLSRIGMMHQNRIFLDAELYFYSGKFHSIGAGGVVLIMWTRVGSQYALKRFCAFLAQ